MRGKSHHHLGQLLARQVLPALSPRQTRLFLLGCVQPDRNPATYLKGSCRALWLRGLHWPNSRPYILRTIARLQGRRKLRLVDCYRLGKLIHYMADAFTYPHNPHFPGTLADHRHYEVQLQHYFLRQQGLPRLPEPLPQDPKAMLCLLHRRYAARPGDPARDSRYCLLACAGVLARILE